MSMRRLALVESPAQLLNVFELDQREPQPESTKIAVLAPASEPTRTQLRAMTSLARQDGHEVSWYEPRLGGASVARSVRAMAAEIRGIDRLVVGDPFSGVIQVIISITRPTEVTIVDDGTATLEFARQWATGEPLTRWHQRPESCVPEPARGARPRPDGRHGTAPALPRHRVFAPIVHRPCRSPSLASTWSPTSTHGCEHATGRR